MAKPSSLIKNLRKKTGSVSFTESKWGTPSHYISTGDYGLNQIISGSIYKGIPAGRVIVFAGESQSLKTIQVIRIAAEALNMHEYDNIFYFDSEGGGGAKTFEAFGCDLDKIEHILVETTEDATIKMIQTLKAVEEHQKTDNPNYKAAIILDSLGNLENDKTFRDIEKNRLAADQGAAAKVKNKLCRAMTIPALKTECPIMIINWVYDGPSLYTAKIKDQPGGKGAQFVGAVNIQCAKLLEKSDDTTEGQYYENSLITMFTVKNRLIAPYLSTKVHVSFTEGLNLYPYLSLFDSAVNTGFIIKETSQSYTIPSWNDPAKKFKKKVLMGGDIADEVWNTFIKEYDVVMQKEIEYSTVTTESITDLGFTEDEAKKLLDKVKQDDSGDSDENNDKDIIENAD